MWSGRRTHLQHVKQGGLAGIVETQEQQLRVLVRQSEAGEDIPDCERRTGQLPTFRNEAHAVERVGYLHQLTIHIVTSVFEIDDLGRKRGCTCEGLKVVWSWPGCEAFKGRVDSGG